MAHGKDLAHSDAEDCPTIPIRGWHRTEPLDDVETAVHCAQMKQDGQNRPSKSQAQVQNTVASSCARVIQWGVGSKGGIQLELFCEDKMGEGKTISISN